MSEHTVAMPLSGEEIVEAILEKKRLGFKGDCYLNPALAYLSFKYHDAGVLTVYDNGREVEIPFETDIAQLPPNVVRQGAGLPIPTLVEDSQGKKEVKNVKYGKMMVQSGPGGTQQDPGKQDPGKQQEPNPHRPGTPEHEKHEKDRKEREEREKKERGNR